MDKEKFIKEKSQWLFDQVAADGDDLDLHIIESILDEVYEAGIEEAKQHKEK